MYTTYKVGDCVIIVNPRLSHYRKTGKISEVKGIFEFRYIVDLDDDPNTVVRLKSTDISTSVPLREYYE